MSIEDLAPGMACPFGGDTTGVIPALARGRLRSTRRRIVTVLGEKGVPLSRFGEGAESAWRPEVGLSLLALRKGRATEGALQLALGMAGAGGIGSVSLDLDVPAWLYFDGYLVAASGATTVRGAGDEVIIEVADTLIRFQRPSTRWVAHAGPFGPWAVHGTDSVAPRYVTSSGIRHAVEGFPWVASSPDPGLCAEPRVSDASRIVFIREGWDLIVKAVPEYAYWVANTALGCLLLDESGTHEAQSGSSHDHPGLIAIEPPPSAAYCGELLVHECSHQHMLAYMMAVPLVTPGSIETSWSPIKRMDRTIDRVLTGGHAVGNMVLYYESLRRKAVLDNASHQRLELHRQWFEDDYAPTLEKSPVLTPIGKLFWSTLCAAVRASDARTVA